MLEKQIDNNMLPEKVDAIKGHLKAALMIVMLDQEISGKIWPLLTDDEIINICKALNNAPSLTPDITENLIINFIEGMTSATTGILNMSQTEKMLSSVLPSDRVNNLMEEIRGPAGNNIWEKISNVDDNLLVNYLKNEYPQTIAVILSRINPEQSAKILTLLPNNLSINIINRMLTIRPLQREIISKIEHTLRNEFMSNLSQTREGDNYGLLADVFNNFDRQTETRFLSVLEENNREAAENIKSLMFTFDDLSNLNSQAIQLLLRYIPRDQLVLSIKGASTKIRDYFFENMSERAKKTLNEDIEILGPVKLKDVDTAQTAIVNMAKDLAAKGEIEINKGNSNDELVY